jgi:hypothetical protein
VTAAEAARDGFALLQLEVDVVLGWLLRTRRASIIGTSTLTTSS